MSLVKISGNASGTGTLTIAAPNTNTNYTLTLPTQTGTLITTAGGQAVAGTTGAFTTTVGVGGATPAASGAGITFPATASASSDANTLDDYEEGTWTPTLTTDATNFTSVTYSTQTGSYTKIGNLCFIRGTMITNAVTVGSASGNVQIGGLPFTVTGADNAINCNYATDWAGEDPLNGLGHNTNTKFYLYYRASVDGNSITTKPADVGTGSFANLIYFSGSYTVA
jgi:hypothetical protein